MLRSYLRSSVLLVLVACDGEAPAPPQPANPAPFAEFTPSAKRTADCEEGDPGRERYGTDCGCCHGSQFAASGSVAAEAAANIRHVEVVDRLGQVFFMPPNPYGNFFAHRPRPEMPMRAKVVFRDGREHEMKDAIAEASCNHCHRASGPAKPIGSTL